MRDLRPGDLDPVELDVAAAAELEPEDELQLRERRDLALQALDRLLDQLGVLVAIARFLPGDRLAVAEEAAGRPVVGQGREPDGGVGALGDRARSPRARPCRSAPSPGRPS